MNQETPVGCLFFHFSGSTGQPLSGSGPGHSVCTVSPSSPPDTELISSYWQLLDVRQGEITTCLLGPAITTARANSWIERITPAESILQCCCHRQRHTHRHIASLETSTADSGNTLFWEWKYAFNNIAPPGTPPQTFTRQRKCPPISPTSAQAVRMEKR